MDEKMIEAAFKAADDEFMALRIGLKVLTAALAATMPEGVLADGIEGAVEDVRAQPEVPERVLAYLGELAEVARKAAG